MTQPTIDCIVVALSFGTGLFLLGRYAAWEEEKRGAQPPAVRPAPVNRKRA